MSLQGMIEQYGKTVDLYAVTNTVDAGGYPVRTFAVSKRDLTVMIVPKDTREEIEAGRPWAGMTATAYFPPGVTVSSEDRIVFKDGSTTRTLEINSLRNSLMLNADNHLARRIADVTEVEKT